MKNFCFIFFLFFQFSALMYGQDYYAMCEVVETNRGVSVNFGDGSELLGIEYIKRDLFDADGKLKKDYSTAFAVVARLTKYWKWEQCGNPLYDNVTKTMVYSLRHKIVDFNTNLFKQIELFKKYEQSLHK